MTKANIKYRFILVFGFAVDFIGFHNQIEPIKIQ